MSWDPFQREVLAELGHVLYRQAGTAAAGDAAPVRVDAPGTLDAVGDDPMLARVARAAGVSVDALRAGIVDLQGVIGNLRGNASAKRALWPRLRALRRQPA